MIYKCPNCNGPLEYNPVTDEMECAYCGGGYTMQEMNTDVQIKKKEVQLSETAGTSEEEEISVNGMEKEISAAEEDFLEEMEMMECKIYTCSSCGGELAVNNTEVSTYCAYCGQPTIIYSRVSKTRKPKYIIPFRVTKEEAVEKFRKHIRRNLLAPGKAKKIDLEMIKGIYVPYFLFDVYYQDELTYALKKTSRIIKAKCELQKVCCDASTVVEDEFAHYLEPYDFSELREFEGGYLSGFYADRNDLSARQLTNVAVRRCKELFEDELRREIKQKVKFTSHDSNYKFYKADYTLMPVWFMTFRWKEKPYTMMVNGQTGKVVGSSPLSKGKIAVMFILVFLICLAAVLFMVWKGFYSIAGDDFTRAMTPALMAHVFTMPAVVIFIISISCMNKIKKNFKMTTLKRTEKFVKQRQEDE